MSVSRGADGRWFVKFKDYDKWKQRAFRDEQTARAFDAEHATTDAHDARLSAGELVVLFIRSNPDMLSTTKKRIVWLFAEGGPCAFMRDKYAEMLNRQDLERMREACRFRKNSNNTINKYQAYIHSILAWGADQDLIQFNPWRDYKRLKQSKYIVNATMEGFRRVYEHLPPYLQWAMKTAFFLSLRPGLVELFGLRWSAFDFARGIVTVRQGKSGALKHVVPQTSYLLEAKRRYATDMRSGIEYVCHRNGMRVVSYRTAWLSACRRAGVKMRPYDVRHLSATTMLAAGADLAATAAQLGHASVTTTGKTYAHVTAGSQAKAAALMPSLDA